METEDFLELLKGKTFKKDGTEDLYYFSIDHHEISVIDKNGAITIVPYTIWHSEIHLQISTNGLLWKGEIGFNIESTNPLAINFWTFGTLHEKIN